MKKKLIVTALLLAVMLIIGCASVSVMTQYDKEIDFNQYRTFHFVESKHKPGKPGQKRPGMVKSPLFTKEVIHEIRPVLEGKGFSEVSSQKDADMLIHIYAFTKNRRDYVPPTYRVGRWGRTWVARPGHAVHYKEGTLAIDVVDRRKKEVVWQGMGKGVLDRKDPAKNLVEAVDNILADFPPEQ